MNAILTGNDPRMQPSFSLRNRLGRLAWGIACALMFRWTPRPLHGWRACVLRLFGARLGRGVHVYPKAVIWAPWNLHMEDHASFADGVECYNIARISVGRDAVVSQGVYLCTGSHDYQDVNFQLIAAPIHIGAKCWICAQSFIGPGVTAGEGSVLGARSVAMKDLAPWTVYAGMPAKAVKPRVLRDRAVS